jgi:hypothetical protein
MAAMQDDDPAGAARPRRWTAIDARLDRPAEAAAPRRQRLVDRRPGLALALAALVIAAVIFAFAPLFTFRALRSAAEYGDVQALAELVDYGALRQSLRTQVRPASVEKRGSADLLRDPIGALRRAWEPVGPQTDVNAYLTPEALARLAHGAPALGGPAPTPGGGLFGGPLPRVRFWSTSRVRLGVSDPAAPGRETILTFQRRKPFVWRLVGVRLPQRPEPS